MSSNTPNRRDLSRAAIALAALAFPSGLAAETALPDPEKLPRTAELPDPLLMLNGERVKTPEEWREKRRPELKTLFQHYMYGRLPPAPEKPVFKTTHTDPRFLDGKATLKLVQITPGPAGTPPIELLVIVPNERKPAPVFLALNFCGNHAIVKDPAVPLPRGWIYSSCRGAPNNKATDEGRGSQAEDWAVEATIARGYALATFYSGDIDPDQADVVEGIHGQLMKAAAGGKAPEPHGRGSIGAWAWGFHRGVDYLLADPDIDGARIAAVGHSRNGKTALLAAALDERIALAIPHQAGCGGTAPSRGKTGESVKQINNAFPHWFNGEFKKFNDDPARLPFDQNCLVALVAPRPVLFSNAVEDTWANPDGQFEVLRAAEPVYRLLGTGGLDAKERPEIGKLVSSRLGYFIRAGKHSMIREDWKAFLDFADAQWGKK